MAQVIELCKRTRIRDNAKTYHVVEDGKLREIGETRYHQLDLHSFRADTFFSTSDKQFRMQYKTVYLR